MNTEPVSTEPVPTELVPTEPASTEPVSTEPVSTKPDSLRRDLKTLLDTGKFSDVTIVVGEHKYPVHKLILVTRSPVLFGMLETDMQEDENVIEISDMKHEIVEKMLEFIYTGEVTDMGDSGKELLVAAEKYRLADLKSRCEEVLSRTGE